MKPTSTPEWVSVSENLPPQKVPVLLYRGGKDTNLVIRQKVVIGWLDGALWSDLAPSHWMPLPEYPE